jgi:hypothetical protein
VGELGALVLVASGLVLLVAGLVGFFFPKPPPVDFSSFLGGHTRLDASLTGIVLGVELALAGLSSQNINTS